jgi:quercetin dioxygenase-like cupin family protein
MVVRAKPNAKDSEKTVYVYDFAELDQVPQGKLSAKVSPRDNLSKKSSSIGSAVTGEAMHVGIVRKKVGTGAKPHTHPNEQFSYVLEGMLQFDFEDQTVLVPPGSVIHIPANVVHSSCATGDGDAVFFVCKDTRHGMAGPPVDGIYDGPRYLPGYGPNGKIDN